LNRLAQTCRAAGSVTRRHRAGHLALISAILSLSPAAAPANTAAATVTIGSPLGSSFAPVEYTVLATAANTDLPEAGATLTSPITGTIVRWRIGGAIGGPYRLRVLTPFGSDVFGGVATSGPVTSGSAEIRTIAANLPIRTGQTIGVDNSSSSDTLGVAGVIGARFISIEPPLPDGAVGSATFSQSNSELQFNADVQPPPTVASINPASGRTGGGTVVTVAGRDFIDVTAVQFGQARAQSFSVGSESTLTAVAPPGSRGTVDVRVTTPAGTSLPAHDDEFTYADRASRRCVVPKLRGKRLRVAKRRLHRFHCRLGRVKGPKRALSRVTSQKPGPGAVLPAGSMVRVRTVAPGRRSTSSRSAPLD
jgi:hypothetical protein